MPRTLKDYIEEENTFKPTQEWLEQAKANSMFDNWRWNEGEFAPNKGYNPSVHGHSNNEVITAYYLEMKKRQATHPEGEK